jgi:hypothetical protein
MEIIFMEVIYLKDDTNLNNNKYLSLSLSLSLFNKQEPYIDYQFIGMLFLFI